MPTSSPIAAKLAALAVVLREGSTAYQLSACQVSETLCGYLADSEECLEDGLDSLIGELHDALSAIIRRGDPPTAWAAGSALKAAECCQTVCERAGVVSGMED